MLQVPDQSTQTCVIRVLETYKRNPYNPTQSENARLRNPGTARANLAASLEAPQGTQTDSWAAKHSHQTVLQQHCDYFDPDHDGVVWPIDTFRGLRNLGFNLLHCLVAVFIINGFLSYPTVPGLLPDLFFRVYVQNIHKSKHGSDTGTYDNEGRFIPQKFEDVFSKYADGRVGLTKWGIVRLLHGQRGLLDPAGWAGAIMEWLFVYLLIWPEDGIIKKEDVRRVYDGSIFAELSLKRSGKAYAT
ncbi:Caleosin-domain-containing protein [Laetiporus sulphureus 93-53]|uniref:Caleosin-domain-containing protein n=1 Tax=Laetiporus sulphureus 93-53 TaxID=1314785 RepID=A0A165GYR7_9APHY|nr:Caleosin-domain-containing protein [Laetiporus sulphureus 93-53]KZT11008.1 Caleosin-domain-containing protein [Laetiporus sulphureus 93-53]